MLNAPTILYEDNDVLAINKPSGLLVHAYGVGKAPRAGHAKRATEETLVDWLRAERPEVMGVGDAPDVRPGIVHRLDRDASGVMLIAKNQRALEHLKNQFQKREIKKTYIALVRGVPKARRGTIEAPIGIRNGTVKRTVHGGRMVKLAVTEYAVEKEIEYLGGKCALLKVFPKTGRTHQIRVHLASIGTPIIGDKIYGHAKENQKTTSPRLMLHALSVEFTLPSGGQMRIEADIPTELSTTAI